MKGACDGTNDTAWPSRVIPEPIATQQRVQLSRRSLSQRIGRPCARCGVVFQRTPVRWMTCLNCYLVNSRGDPLEFPRWSILKLEAAAAPRADGMKRVTMGSWDEPTGSKMVGRTESGDPGVPEPPDSSGEP